MPKRLRDVPRFMAKERLASFVTVSPEEQPHCVPVFFTYADGKVYVQTDRHSVKVRNLLTNNKVAVAVYRGEEAVIVRGKGRIVPRDDEFMKRTQEHIAKYRLILDEEGRDSMGIPLFDQEVRCVVEVACKRVIFW